MTANSPKHRDTRSHLSRMDTEIPSANFKHIYPNWFLQARNSFELSFRSALPQLAPTGPLASAFEGALQTGRRIRPTLHFAFWHAETGAYPDESQAQISVAVELFHSASIIVDDLADKDDIRRDKHPAHADVGEDLATLLSHFLVGCGYELLLERASNSHLPRTWTKYYKDACQGQSHDYARNLALTLKDQHDLSLRKTTPFFSFIGETLDHFLSRQYFSPLMMVLARVFQVSNDVVDLLDMDTSPRQRLSSVYPLRLSYLVPSLVDRGIITQDEVFAEVPLARLQEIASLARRSGFEIESTLENERLAARDQIDNLRLPAEVQAIAVDFADHCCTPSFWKHHHATNT